jgi:hypothetical protein
VASIGNKDDCGDLDMSSKDNKPPDPKAINRRQALERISALCLTVGALALNPRAALAETYASNYTSNYPSNYGSSYYSGSGGTYSYYNSYGFGYYSCHYYSSLFGGYSYCNYWYYSVGGPVYGYNSNYYTSAYNSAYQSNYSSQYTSKFSLSAIRMLLLDE